MTGWQPCSLRRHKEVGSRQLAALVKPSAQCHLWAQSPPGRRPNDKYPVNTPHRSDLCKNVSLLCYLITAVIHTLSLCSPICIYVYNCVCECVCIYIYIYTHTHTHTHAEPSAHPLHLIRRRHCPSIPILAASKSIPQTLPHHNYLTEIHHCLENPIKFPQI